MIARTQYDVGADDLAVVLALVRGRTLAGAAERIGLDASTVFRHLQRIERGLGQPLFERTRAGYAPTGTAARLAAHAEEVESAVEAARSAVQAAPARVSGTVRIATTDTILHGLLAPALRELKAAHPLLAFELQAANEVVSLTRRDADIALRATRRPPQHLVGRPVGPIRVAVYAPRLRGGPRWRDVEAGTVDWIAPDDALPEHPSVVWRRRRFPKIVPRYRVNSILSVLELVALGLGVGVVPLFLAQGRRELLRLTEPIEECETQLWLLAHAEARHLTRIAATYAHLSARLALE
jgi:DNA-binding transcriptional LysR family regulator